MNYQQTLDYLFAKLPMYSRIGAAAFKADLTNTIALCASIGNPQLTIKTVHIAGTNGKGSTSHMLAAVFQKAGYKTGLYTSPHLVDFRERIRVNGEMVKEDFVVRFTERIKPQITVIEPSFFEITVAMAFSYFAEEQVDIAIIETGLGGRLDSTNIIIPELSVITNIGWDHMNMLGDSLEKIAGEKAGIIKQAVPVVIGETLPETITVFERAATEKATVLSRAADFYYAESWEEKEHVLEVTVVDKRNDEHSVYELDLQGFYQTKNLLTVLTALRILRTKGWQMDIAAVREGLRYTRHLTGLQGRWEIVHTRPRVVLDVAHNEDGIRQVLAQADATDHTDLYFVLGMVKDKEIEKVIALLPEHAQYYFTQAAIPRALPAQELANKAAAAGLTGIIVPDVNTGLKAALQKAAPSDLIIVCGSVFLVGEVNRSLFG
ncbi:MAG: bifunctional folylpolyglutamate synthase/dihydrofolate synthase [Bacteroidota bacterium]|nr:bifunctional folylpolyglutamate synthase/dihydrofolate synthase [Bacteroidota bacterium]